MTLFTLPLEIQKDIVSKTAIIDWAFCYQVSKKYRELIRQCLPEDKLPENRIIKPLIIFDNKDNIFDNKNIIKDNKNNKRLLKKTAIYARNFSFVDKKSLCNDDRITNWPRRAKVASLANKWLIPEYRIDERCLKDIVKYMPPEELIKLVVLRDEEGCSILNIYIINLICRCAPLETLLALRKTIFFSEVIRLNCYYFLLHNKDNIAIFANEIIQEIFVEQLSDPFSSIIETEIIEGECSNNLFNLLLHKKIVGKGFLKDITRYPSTSYWDCLLKHYSPKKDILIDEILKPYESRFIIDSADLGLWFIDNGFLLDQDNLDNAIFDKDYDSEGSIEAFYKLIMKSNFAPESYLLYFYIKGWKYYNLHHIKRVISKECYEKNKEYIKAKISEIESKVLTANNDAFIDSNSDISYNSSLSTDIDEYFGDANIGKYITTDESSNSDSN